jgi:ferric-dicitrate binding protein FerR (iron transport regulator)
MTPPDETPVTPAEQRARDAVRQLPHERADDAFRARLKHEFTSGRIGRRREQVRERRWFARPEVLVPFAAGVLLALVVRANRGPDWRVLAATGEGRVWVGERGFAASETAAMSLALRRGGRVRVEGTLTLELGAPGVVAVGVGPGAEMTLSAAPDRLWGRAMRAQLASGDAWFTTGARFRGATLDVATPEASVRAVGTSFAVLRHDSGTCVCVMEGHVHAGAAATPGETTDVPQGMRRTFDPSGKSEVLPILDDSIHRLHMQRSRWGATLGR